MLLFSRLSIPYFWLLLSRKYSLRSWRWTVFSGWPHQHFGFKSTTGRRQVNALHSVHSSCSFIAVRLVVLWAWLLVCYESRGLSAGFNGLRFPVAECVITYLCHVYISTLTYMLTRSRALFVRIVKSSRRREQGPLQIKEDRKKIDNPKTRARKDENTDRRET